MSSRFIRYIEGESPIHRLDPTKLTFILFFVLSLTLASDIILLVPPVSYFTHILLLSRPAMEQDEGHLEVHPDHNPVSFSPELPNNSGSL